MLVEQLVDARELHELSDAQIGALLQRLPEVATTLKALAAYAERRRRGIPPFAADKVWFAPNPQQEVEYFKASIKHTVIHFL